MAVNKGMMISLTCHNEHLQGLVDKPYTKLHTHNPYNKLPVTSG